MVPDELHRLVPICHLHKDNAHAESRGLAHLHQADHRALDKGAAGDSAIGLIREFDRLLVEWDRCCLSRASSVSFEDGAEPTDDRTGIVRSHPLGILEDSVSEAVERKRLKPHPAHARQRCEEQAFAAEDL